MSLRVNLKQYDWSDIDIGIPGLFLVFQSIDYDDELEKELAYGYGNKPLGWGGGNYKATAKVTMLRDHFDDLTDYCKRTGTPLYKLMFPKISVSYANEGDRTVTDILNKVGISKIAHKGSQGDKEMKVDIDLLVVGTVNRDGVEPV